MGNQRTRYDRLKCQSNSNATGRRINANGNRVSSFRVFNNVMIALSNQFKTSTNGRIHTNQNHSRFTCFTSFTSPNRISSLYINRRIYNKKNSNTIRTLHSRQSTDSRRRQAIQVSTGLHNQFATCNNAIIASTFNRKNSNQTRQRASTLSINSNAQFRANTLMRNASRVNPADTRFVNRTNAHVLLVSNGQGTRLIYNNMSKNKDVPTRSNRSVHVPHFGGKTRLNNFSLPFYQRTRRMRIETAQRQRFFSNIRLMTNLQRRVLLRARHDTSSNSLYHKFSITGHPNSHRRQVSVSNNATTDGGSV